MNEGLPDLDYTQQKLHYYWNGGQAKHISHHAGSKSNIQKIKTMMAKCSEQHDFCIGVEGSLSRIRRLPKRVIEVGDEDNAGIRVFEHAYDQEVLKRPYIALSHTWGDTKHTKLMRSNHEQRCANIPYQELPPLYQDAITITRAFGVRYIWIDSLCIFQDPKDDDFSIEGAKMALIYEGAEFVLAATSSPDGDAGLCLPREPYRSIRCKTTDGEDFTVFARQKCCHEILGDQYSAQSSNAVATRKECPQYWDKDIMDSLTFQSYPLHFRAWCLQERLLAPKVLHFVKQELIFECLTSLECECGFYEDHGGDPLLPSRREIKSIRSRGGEPRDECSQSSKHAARESLLDEEPHIVKKKPEAYVIEADKMNSSQYHELWRDLVVQYSQKGVSYPKDGLAAIAGLAERWERDNITGYYLAGLWEKNILTGLRWKPDTEEPESVLFKKFEQVEQEIKQRQPGDQTLDRYIAPSWSWASIQRGVCWSDGYANFDEDEYFVSVKEDHPPACAIEFEGFKYGPVRNGYIFLTGEIMAVEFWIPEVKDFRNTCFLEKNGTPRGEVPDSISRLEAQPILEGRISKHGTEIRQLYCLRFCSTPHASFGTRFGGNGGVGEEGALLLVDARPLIKKRQPAFIQDYTYVFERIGFTYCYPREAWDHASDSKRVDLFIV